jgi:hypothetical protein
MKYAFGYRSKPHRHLHTSSGIRKHWGDWNRWKKVSNTDSGQVIELFNLKGSLQQKSHKDLIMQKTI